ncbi:MAG: TetR/AcrR family transcriptional regulator, partial [Planctomycetes bacterium]|nr:TetR/AcrR family transcriptional regulator [Planctomycetota bacterium]
NRRFHEITLDEIAQAAGVGKGTIYYYFADKDDLFFQVATSGFEELCELLKQTVPCDTLFGKKLLNACKQITSFFAARRQLLQITQTEANLAYWRKGEIRQRWLAKRKMLVDAVADIFRQGIAEGVVRSDISAEVMATLLLGMLRTRSRDLREVPGNMKNSKLLVDIFLNGVHTSHNDVTREDVAMAEIELNY